jgi:hypothetical protein
MYIFFAFFVPVKYLYFIKIQQTMKPFGKKLIPRILAMGFLISSLSIGIGMTSIVIMIIIGVIIILNSIIIIYQKSFPFPKRTPYNASCVLLP